MWMINFLPDWVFHLTLFIGILLFLVSVVLNVVPFVLQYRLAIQAVSIILIAFGTYTEGAISNEEFWKARVSDAEQRAKEAEISAANISAQVEYVYVDRIKKITETKYITKDLIKKAKKSIDSKCTVTPEAIDILNKSAQVPQ
jgi:hypothetical protein